MSDHNETQEQPQEPKEQPQDVESNDFYILLGLVVVLFVVIFYNPHGKIREASSF
jgi:hypothetical protein